MNHNDALLLMDALGSLTHTGLTKRGQDISDRHAQAQQGYNNAHLQELIREADLSNAEHNRHNQETEKLTGEHYKDMSGKADKANEVAGERVKQQQLATLMRGLKDGTINVDAFKASMQKEMGPIISIMDQAGIPLDSLRNPAARVAGAAPTANGKDIALQDDLWNQVLDANDNEDEYKAIGAIKGYNTIEGINEKASTPQMPADSTTVTVGDPKNPFNSTRTTTHLHPGQPAASPTGGPPPTDDKVMMIHPSGARGLVPRAQVQAAQAKGYKLDQ